MRQVRPADHIQHHVDPAGLLGDGTEVLSGDVDGDVGAQILGGLGLVGAPAGGDHLGAGGLGHLDGGDPDAGGRTVDHQGLAGLQGAVLEDVDEDGEHRFGQARGLGEVQPLGDR